MLKKLIKHDFRAFSRTLLPLQLGVLGGGILAAILARLSMAMMGGGASDAVSGWMTLFSILSILLTGALVMAICASALVTLVLICIRLQRSFFGDEGYLTFALPTTADKLLWSKIIVGAIWMLINLATIALTMFVFTAFGTAEGSIINASVVQSFGGLFKGLFDLIGALFSAEAVPGMWLMAILGLLDVLAFALLQILVLYFAVIAGGRASKKHWLLAAIGIYLACSFCLGFITSVCGVAAFATVAAAGPIGGTWLLLIGALVVLGGLSAALFFWSRHLLKNRLNVQ